MFRKHLQFAILLFMAFLLLAETASVLADSFINGSNIFSAEEVEAEFDEEEGEAEELLAIYPGCTSELVNTHGLSYPHSLLSELLSVSGWHLRGPPQS